jgi:hypothetical protein
VVLKAVVLKADEPLIGWCPELGVDDLTEMTLRHLENHALRPLWAAAQNNNADLKIERKCCAPEYNLPGYCTDPSQKASIFA